FERIRDELRDGRVLVSAVEAGWKRALRTIFASDAVNFLAAIVLFLLAVGNVRGFALTLGLTTIVDVLVVTMFTHPMLQLLANTEFFGGGHRFSGLDPRALGAVYRGRAQFREPVPTTKSGKGIAAGKEAARRQTIAERKAAELAAAAPQKSSARAKGKDS
ncbi:MAG: protein translocase subunit SecD, partial [Salinibacterium sp.]|nr:protein translocase subunit SecD [Salinibacterium sp.]